jgi:hypothetical protein
MHQLLNGGPDLGGAAKGMETFTCAMHDGLIDSYGMGVYNYTNRR